MVRRWMLKALAASGAVPVVSALFLGGYSSGPALADSHITCDLPFPISREEMVQKFMALDDYGDRVRYMRQYGRGFIEVVPGFAGFILDRNNNSIAYVYMLDPSDQEAAERAVDLTLGVGMEGGSRRDIREVRPIQAQYSWTQLLEWGYCFDFRTPQLSKQRSSDIDESDNRVSIGFASEEDIALAEQELAALGLPREAFIFAVTGPITPSGGDRSESRTATAPLPLEIQPTATPVPAIQSSTDENGPSAGIPAMAILAGGAVVALLGGAGWRLWSARRLR